MSTNTTTVDARPDDVWAVLSDGWLYPLFVVGASRMRDVDDSWPRVGARLHHSVGTWPALLDDETAVLEVEPGHRLLLRARAWPGGAAEVEITIRPHGDATQVTLREDAVSGPGRLVPKPVRDMQLAWRNTETLRRLRLVCEGRRTGS